MILNEVAQVAAVPPCARKSAVHLGVRSSCSFFSQLPGQLPPDDSAKHFPNYGQESHTFV
jgi:hypothetical protein